MTTALKKTNSQTHHDDPSVDIIQREIYIIANVTRAVVAKSIKTSLANVLALVLLNPNFSSMI